MITAGAKGFVLKQASVEELQTAIREVYKGGNDFSKELLHSVIVDMHGLEKELAEEKKELLKISEREMEMLSYICQGLTNKELAEKLFVSIKTIESNKARLMQKTNTKNTAGLIVWAVKNKIIKL
jgi:DNA-binding NarL/FixJ family response regulator